MKSATSPVHMKSATSPAHMKSATSSADDCGMDDLYVRIPEGFGYCSAYVDITMCLPASSCGCYHLVKYSDGRSTLAGGDSICRMFLNRRYPIHDHFKRHIYQMRVKKSSSGARYFSII